MSSEATQERWKRYSDRARDIADCDTGCTVEEHIRAIRFAQLEAYYEGRRDAAREQREAVRAG